MAKWIVEYTVPETANSGQVIVDVPNVDSAADVERAIEKGEVKDLYVREGLIFRVSRRVR